MIKILLENPETEARITKDDVLQEIERLSVATGIDLEKYLDTENEKLYFRASQGTLFPPRWSRLLPYGTERCKADSPEAFALFFLLANGMPFANHHKEWAEFAWECWEDRVGAIIEAARGLGKTIFMRSAQAYFMGLYPAGSSIIVRSADTPAKTSADGVAKIISDNPVWQMWFPHIKPKSLLGQSGGSWSASAGYSVIDTSVSAEEWSQIETARTSPSLTKFGLGGHGILGSRPNLVMLADDIHDKDNSNTQSLLDDAIGRFQGHLEPACTPSCRKMIIGTPWGLQDLLQVLPLTGQWRKIKVAITREGTYPGTPTWHQMFDEEEIKKRFEGDTSIGKIEFKRNYLLDLEADVALQIDFGSFSHNKIQDHWLRRIGVDFAELEEGSDGRGRSFFCAVVTAQEPETGTWIVEDGIVKQLLQEQAENVIVGLFDKYGGNPPIEVICIENIGGGAVWQQYMARTHRNMPIVGEKGGGVPKEARWERMLAPYLGHRKILISDKDHPFLDRVRQALRMYPHINKRGDWAADVFDAMVWAHYHAFMETGDPLRRRKLRDRKPNPWLKLARMGREDEEKDEDK